MRIKQSSRIAYVSLIASAIGGALVLVPANPAAAATARNGVCESGEFCYYYLDNQGGSLSDFASSVADYGTEQPTCYDFKGAGSGQGQCIKNNASSVWNRSSHSVTVYFNSNYSGFDQTISSGQSTNLNSTLTGENASHKFN